ncbi:hypothetical protein SISNIDRAFT_491355 [Sistotremastrum niveocremeum HHB9708]|uniref:Uncharacterized protein n=1 Tax=Sistotremastrum niveocremeum HHB9708 TaxID=1314777 RepID=A0A164MXG7_9AGAM|nr:hypothetical protein SISNIDRAFT_491355 [Sistotremastrum niveocremeum HHB9708]
MFTPAPINRSRGAHYGTPVSPFVAFSPQRSFLRAATVKSPKSRTTPLVSRLLKSKLSIAHLTDPPSSPSPPTDQYDELGSRSKSSENESDVLLDIGEDADLVAQQQLLSARERCYELRERIDSSKRRLKITKALVETQEKHISDASEELKNVEDEIGHWRVLLHGQDAAPAGTTLDDPLELDDSIEMVEEDADAEADEEAGSDTEAGEQAKPTA